MARDLVAGDMEQIAVAVVVFQPTRCHGMRLDGESNQVNLPIEIAGVMPDFSRPSYLDQRPIRNDLIVMMS